MGENCMAGPAGTRVEVVVARTVDRFVGKFDFSALDEDGRLHALHEVVALRSSVGRKSSLIDAALAKLEQRLSRTGRPPSRANPRLARKLARILRVLAPLAIASTAAST